MKIVTKKKGYALIYVMCVMLILTAFTLSIISLVASNMKTTSYTKNSNRAHLAAEAGMEEAVNTFKGSLSTKYKELLDDPSNAVKTVVDEIDAGEIDSVDEDLKDVIKDKEVREGKTNGIIHQIKNLESSTNRGKAMAAYQYKYDSQHGDPAVRYLQITSTGMYNGVVKTITAWIDKNNISNVYQDRMFNNPITISSDVPSIPIPKEDTTNGFSQLIDKTVTYRVNGKQVDGNNVTLQSLTQKMYEQIIEDEEFKSILSNEVNNPSDPYKYLGLDSSKPGYDELKQYVDSITVDTDTTRDNYIKNMIAYSGIYKVLMVDGSFDVGKMEQPLINYIIYCNGNINISSDSNLKLWNCNIYAKGLKYTGIPYELNGLDGNGYSSITYNQDANSKIISLKYGDKDIPKTAIDEIQGVSKTAARASILKYLMLYDEAEKDDETKNRLYKDYLNNTGDASGNTLFEEGNGVERGVTEFSNTNRNYINDRLNGRVDGYAYGLKLRYIDWEEK